MPEKSTDLTTTRERPQSTAICLKSPENAFNTMLPKSSLEITLEYLHQEYKRGVTDRLQILDQETVSLENTLDRSSFMKPKEREIIQKRFEAIEKERAEIEKLKIKLNKEIEAIKK